MRKPPLSSGLTFDDDDEATIDIDDKTEIDDIPSFMVDDDATDVLSPELNSNLQDIYLDDEDDFGFDDVYDEDDFEFESETEEDSESETEYNPGRQVMDMSAEEIRKHVMNQAQRLSPDMSARDKRTRAQMRYDDLARQGRESEMEDPEFMDTAELPPYEMRRKKIEEHITKKIQQSIRRQILLL